MSVRWYQTRIDELNAKWLRGRIDYDSYRLEFEYLHGLKDQAQKTV